MGAEVAFEFAKVGFGSVLAVFAKVDEEVGSVSDGEIFGKADVGLAINLNKLGSAASLVEIISIGKSATGNGDRVRVGGGAGGGIGGCVGLNGRRNIIHGCFGRWIGGGKVLVDGSVIEEGGYEPGAHSQADDDKGRDN